MVCDPVTAFSVACNVLQVIELGVKTLSKAAAYRKAETGALKEQQDLRDVSQSLGELNVTLSASITEDQPSNQPTAELLRLVEANSQCLRLSKDLIGFLDTLKIRDKHAVFDSLRISIKAMWHKDRMDSMEKSISQARDNLLIAFLLYMNSKQASKMAQDEILANTTRVEGTILNAIASTSNLLQDDIKSLSERLSNITLDSAPTTIAQFAAAHRANFEPLSERLESIFALQSETRANSDEIREASSRQRILNNLHFTSMHERRDHIVKAHHETYRWILERTPQENQHWDNFVSWLGASTSRKRIFWVTGKIGSGKSTLLRFLDDNITVTKHMLPWAHEAFIVRGSFFFWNGGSILQKSITGLLRTLLMQLFQQTPDLISQVVPSEKWQNELLPDAHFMEWSAHELRDCLQSYIAHSGMSRKIFLLVDGLDELSGKDEERDGLIDLFVDLAAHKNVKMCLSSRPWNIFRDAFERCPQLKLEDLTYNDIEAYVRGQLYGNRRFQTLMQSDGLATEILIKTLISKASGVFLWVRLVVKELLRGVRDGDGTIVLKRRVEDIPTDMDDYLLQIFESIEPRYRWEASILLQLALHQEDEFVSLHSNNLIDFSFIEEGPPNFALDPSYDFLAFDLADTDAMPFRLESTMRKINSRCQGLLECDADVTPLFSMDAYRPTIAKIQSTSEFVQRQQDNDHSQSADDGWLPTEIFALDMAQWPVVFLHRSLRDFLLAPKMQALLHQSTRSAYDARLFFLSARFVQLLALHRLGAGIEIIGLASYVLSALSVPTYRDTPGAAIIATLAKPAVETLAQVDSEQLEGHEFWYVYAVISTWKREGSDFLTLAIDFGLQSYVRAHLTAQAVQSKKGRPILDYMLRPRFAAHVKEPHMCVGSQIPDLALLKIVLEWGACPNQKYDHSSVWALFLCFIADHFYEIQSNTTFWEEATYLEAIRTLIEEEAEVLLPRG